GRRNVMVAARDRFGEEVPLPPDVNVPIVSRDVVLARAEAIGQKIGGLRRLAPADVGRGVFISRIRRMQQDIPPLPGTVLQRGDVITLLGTQAAVTRVTHEFGHPLPPSDKSDFIFLGAGILTGILIGSLSWKIGALDLTLGTGGGALLSGLGFGWLRARFP